MPVSTEFTVSTTNVSSPCYPSVENPETDILSGKRRYNIKLWKTFTDCFNCLPIAAIIDEKIFTMHGGLSPDLNSMEQIRRVMRPTDVPDTGELQKFVIISSEHRTNTKKAFCVIYCGRIPTKISPGGVRMTEECLSPSDPTSSLDSYRNTIWISSVGHIRLSKTDTNSSRNDN